MEIKIYHKHNFKMETMFFDHETPFNVIQKEILTHMYMGDVVDIEGDKFEAIVVPTGEGLSGSGFRFRKVLR